MKKQQPHPARYNIAPAPSVVPKTWRWLARVALLVLSLGAGYFIGNTLFNELRLVRPAFELTWTDKRAIKPSRMGVREFTQYVGLERRFIEDSMRTLLPTSINVNTIWSTCGTADCVRPSLANLMSLASTVEDKVNFTQRVCALSTRFLGSNIAGVVWTYDAGTAKCIASNWEQISQDVKRANTHASLTGVITGLLVSMGLFVLGLWVLRMIEQRIDANDREIGIEP